MEEKKKDKIEKWDWLSLGVVIGMIIAFLLDNLLFRVYLK